MEGWALNSIDQQLFDLALAEDLNLPFSDVTTNALFQNDTRQYKARIVSKEKNTIVICGIPVVKALCQKMELPFEIDAQKQDGDLLEPGETLLTIESQAALLLTLERTLLNFLRHLSAIATLTKRFVDLTRNTPMKILDTRKTTPGMRHLEKYAVHCGGGVNHRLGLYDAYMIKDTHNDLMGSLEETLERIPNKKDNPLPVIFEVRDLEELKNVIAFGHDKITRVLLDNMSPEMMKEAVALCGDIFETEASGNLSLENIQDVANSGVQFASVGMLTYSAGQIDLSMKTTHLNFEK